VWTGYIRRVRWTWFVMFLIVWAWDFPILILPYLHGWRHIDIFAAISDAWYESGLSRIFVEVSLAFVLMVFALVFPLLEAFAVGRWGGPGEPGCAHSGAPDKPEI
jgi:hypothetical protein